MEYDQAYITKDLLEEAEGTYKANFHSEVRFERSIFFSLHYSENEYDYSSIVMDTRKIPKTKRNIGSIMAEAYLCKKFGWEITINPESQDSTFEELVSVLNHISATYDVKLSLVSSSLSPEEISLVKPYVNSIIAPIITINKEIQKRLNLKSVSSSITMFGNINDIEKGINLILGIGETIDDIKELHRFIETHGIKKVIFYPYIPQRNTLYARPASSFYIARWIAETRIKFPKIQITAGTWFDRVAEVGLFLRAGANSITNFPAFRFFNSEQSKAIEEECRNSERSLKGTLTDTRIINTISYPDLNDEVKGKLEKYITLLKSEK